MGTKISLSNNLDNEFQRFIESKLRIRLANIVWGKNCDSLKEALTFNEPWLFSDELRMPEYQPALQEFLFKNGFAPKRTILNGRVNSTWMLSKDTKNSTFKEIRKLYEEGYEMAVSNFKEDAREKVYNHGISLYKECMIDITNHIFRNCILEEIPKYNQKWIYCANKGQLDSRFEFLYWRETMQRNLLIMSKDENIYLEDYESEFTQKINGVLYNFFSEIYKTVRHIRKNPPKKFIAYIPSEFLESFKISLKLIDIQVDFFAQYSEINYTRVGVPQIMDSPVFIEIPDLLEYRDVSNNVYINMLFSDFVRCYYN